MFTIYWLNILSPPASQADWKRAPSPPLSPGIQSRFHTLSLKIEMFTLCFVALLLLGLAGSLSHLNLTCTSGLGNLTVGTPYSLPLPTFLSRDPISLPFSFTKNLYFHFDPCVLTRCPIQHFCNKVPSGKPVPPSIPTPHQGLNFASILFHWALQEEIES